MAIVKFFLYGGNSVCYRDLCLFASMLLELFVCLYTITFGDKLPFVHAPKRIEDFLRVDKFVTVSVD